MIKKFELSKNKHISIGDRQFLIDHHATYNTQSHLWEIDLNKINTSDEIYFFKKEIEIYPLTNIRIAYMLSMVSFFEIPETTQINILKQLQSKEYKTGDILIPSAEFEKLVPNLYEKIDKQKIENILEEILYNKEMDKDYIFNKYKW